MRAPTWIVCVSLTVSLCVAGCTGPDHRELAARTSFELARSHGRYVEVNGLDTFAIVAGEGPDVILLHGDLSSTYTWRHLIEPLARTRRVHAIDLPGHGFSEKPAKQDFELVNRMSEENVCDLKSDDLTELLKARKKIEEERASIEDTLQEIRERLRQQQEAKPGE